MSHHVDPNKNVNLTIDGIPVTVPEGTKILSAAKKVNINIPVLCEHPELCKRALCRICVVECDGRGKLATACSNDVWEGVKIVTNNKRLSTIRRTIIELILANHPQDCLSCIRNKNCELQSLALSYGIYKNPFNNNVESQPPKIESKTIVREMSKCVKCSRCVEVCQEVQAIRAINTANRSSEYRITTPYEHSLEDSNCVFCGQCAKVCPVGAIYEHDQTAEVWEKLNNNGLRAIAQVSPDLAAALQSECAAEQTITTGKMISAIKLLGFDKVYDASIAAEAANSELNRELEQRQKTGGKLPLISGSSEGVARFVKNFYPDLAAHLSDGKTPRRVFAEDIKNAYSAAEKLEISSITTVSFVPDLSQKYTAKKDETDFALTAKELARMFKLAGIMVETLPEAPFDTVASDLPKAANSPPSAEIVDGYAKAREVMETIHSGKCASNRVIILS
ncbi:MAG: (2Fe-2S)-binding protein [Treponema sp.]|jgi:NADH dehydrogenase/NADH:ubiquinone oxidoreductase subunit G|nr:(2Fe-2S)-binding protein [Treponema sp.]